jgi:FAD-linked oxidoreductase
MITAESGAGQRRTTHCYRPVTRGLKGFRRVGETWTNWTGNQSSVPASIVRPADVGELAEAVRTAAKAGQRVKAVGSGHSFTSIALTEGVQVRLDRLSGLVDHDPETGLVTVFAGTRLRDIPGSINPLGLSMTNLGDIDTQTISGATATGTHGTGARYGGIATQIRALEIVTASGEIVTCSDSERPELFAAARVGLGAFGVISKVTLQCEPQFGLEAREEPMSLAEALDGFHELVDDTDHFEFFWFPHTDRVLAKRNNRVDVGSGLRPLSRLRSLLDDELLTNGVFRFTCEAGHRMPWLIPGINGVASRVRSSRSYSDVMHRVLTFQRRVRFREMEYAIPRESVADVIREVEALIGRRGWRISFPVEVRVADGDDIWLSTAYGRPSAYVAVHQFHRTPHEDYFRDVEQVFNAVDGRPHWGKLHTLDAAVLRMRYPRFEDFCRVRDDLDPEQVFANSYLERVLGLSERV